MPKMYLNGLITRLMTSRSVEVYINAFYMTRRFQRGVTCGVSLKNKKLFITGNGILMASSFPEILPCREFALGHYGICIVQGTHFNTFQPWYIFCNFATPSTTRWPLFTFIRLITFNSERVDFR